MAAGRAKFDSPIHRAFPGMHGLEWPLALPLASPSSHEAIHEKRTSGVR